MHHIDPRDLDGRARSLPKSLQITLDELDGTKRRADADKESLNHSPMKQLEGKFTEIKGHRIH